MRTNIICVDFDGVIMNYAKEGQVGEPMHGSLEAIQWLKGKGYEVVVLTAREDTDEVSRWIAKNMMEKNIIGNVPRVTNVKPAAIAYIDDRAIRFQGNWADILNYF